MSTTIPQKKIASNLLMLTARVESYFIPTSMLGKIEKEELL